MKKTNYNTILFSLDCLSLDLNICLTMTIQRDNQLFAGKHAFTTEGVNDLFEGNEEIWFCLMLILLSETRKTFGMYFHA